MLPRMQKDGTMNTTHAAVLLQGRRLAVASWILQILAAIAFFSAGSAKLAGVPMMVKIFDQIGFGQWFRLVTGLVEIIGATALLIPSLTAFGGLLLATTMVFGVLTHLFIIGGNPAPAVLLMCTTGAIAWLRRGTFASMLRRD